MKLMSDPIQTAGPNECCMGVRPRPINTLPRIPGFSFIGLILEETIDGKPMWNIDHYQFVSGPNLMNRNTANYTQALQSLTHWMPEPEPPMRINNPYDPNDRAEKN
jgi:hypothetical protein